MSTGVSVQGLQRLEAIGVTSGVSMETLARAIGMLQKGLDDKDAQAALRRMGLDYAEIRRLAPEDQFLKLASAVSKIQDPVDRANAGSALFGKTWTQIAPAMKQNLDDVIKNTKTMTDEQVAALDRAGDKWDEWYLNTKRTLRAYMGDLVAADEKFQESQFIWNMPSKLPEVPKLPGAPPLRVGGGATVNDVIDPTMISQLKVYGQTLEENVKSTEKTIKVNKDAETAQERYATAVTGSLERIRYQHFQLGNAALGATKNVDGFQIRMSETVAINRDFSKQLIQSTIKTDAFGHVIAVNLVPSLGKLGKGMQDAGDDTKSFGTTITQYFSKDFGVNIAAAIAGGGNPAKAALTGLGQAMFSKDSSLSKTVSQGVTSIFGSSGMAGKIGGAIGSMVPVIGSFVGPAIEGITKLFSKVFGKSEESKSVSPLRDEFFKLQGGIETLNPRVEQLTGNLTLVQAVFDAKTVEQYNTALTNLNSLFQQETDALALLDETAKRYGFTIEELGPAMQRQQLDKQAQQLFKDWEVLNAAGISTVAITSRMAKGINEYVAQALTMGTEVPDAMRPMLQKMVEMGQLTDASGNKIETLEDSGVSFSMTMSQGFTKLIAEVQKLADVLSRSLGTAVSDTQKQIAKFPSKIPIEVQYTTSGTVPKGGAGAVPGYQGGTHGQFVDFGKGSLVMLHGKEAVVPEDEAGGGAVTTGGSGPAGGAAAGSGITVYIDARGALFNEPGSDQRLAALVERALSARHGLTHRRRAA